MHACMSTHVRACVHACMRACVHSFMHACMYACMRACMRVCLGVGVSACVCVYACMHVCIHALQPTTAHFWFMILYFFHTYFIFLRSFLLQFCSFIHELRLSNYLFFKNNQFYE